MCSVKLVANEPNVKVKLNMYGVGTPDSNIGIPFLDHMLDIAITMCNSLCIDKRFDVESAMPNIDLKIVSCREEQSYVMDGSGKYYNCVTCKRVSSVVNQEGEVMDCKGMHMVLGERLEFIKMAWNNRSGAEMNSRSSVSIWNAFHQQMQFKTLESLLPESNIVVPLSSFLGVPLFGLSEVSKATHNFSVDNKLGEGGFSPTYKMVIVRASPGDVGGGTVMMVQMVATLCALQTQLSEYPSLCRVSNPHELIHPSEVAEAKGTIRVCKCFFS
ncbi:hypothetical protein Tco_1031091 [Tanacetum coccineum]|uniref:Uncharacterized protein n=1 Tax=Tanacetum coccineum TaxID=301880 RepID=A0ABQ5G9H4_9ASTR